MTQRRAEGRTPNTVSRIATAGLLALAALTVRPAQADAQLKTVQTKYYVLHTDLDIDGVREAYIRIDAMAEEYHRRTRGFGGAIRKKLSFYLFKDRMDYYRAGGIPGSAGVFMRRGNDAKLMAIAGEKTSARTWQVVQHEGFHQFAHFVIGGRIPVWVDEGLAEYFGEGLFTGDNLVVGVVPPDRLARLKREIKQKVCKPLREMMEMSHKEWNGELAIANYDQGWSMIHFLVHAEDGKYVGALGKFISDIGRGQRYVNAWVRHFGRDIDAFQKKWQEYWLAQPANPTRDVYTQAVVATCTSYFARAYSRKQTFEDAEAFFKAAQAGDLKRHQLDWLPADLLSRALAAAPKAGTWAVETPENRTPLLVCTTADGTRITGAFVVKLGRVTHVECKVTPKGEAVTQPASRPAPTTRPAKKPKPSPRTRPTTRRRPKVEPVTAAIKLANAYVSIGQTDKARKALAKALKEHPDSPHAPAARKFLNDLK